MWRSVANADEMNLIVESNPYTPPQLPTDALHSSPTWDRRFLFLLLPPLIPLAVHAIVRLFIPSDETLLQTLFALGSIIPAWAWSQSMIDRLRLSFWKSYLLACCVWGAVLVSAFLSQELFDWAFG